MNNDIEDFDKWYYVSKDKCDVREFENTNSYYIAREAWKEARKGYVKVNGCEREYSRESSICWHCRMSTLEVQKEARKGYVKLKDVERILNDNTFHNEHMTALIAYGALAEIRELGDKNDKG